jgi:hypothetical protein
MRKDLSVCSIEGYKISANISRKEQAATAGVVIAVEMPCCESFSLVHLSI